MLGSLPVVPELLGDSFLLTLDSPLNHENEKCSLFSLLKFSFIGCSEDSELNIDKYFAVFGWKYKVLFIIFGLMKSILEVQSIIFLPGHTALSCLIPRKPLTQFSCLASSLHSRPHPELMKDSWKKICTFSFSFCLFALEVWYFFSGWKDSLYLSSYSGDSCSVERKTLGNE